MRSLLYFICSMEFAYMIQFSHASVPQLLLASLLALGLSACKKESINCGVPCDYTEDQLFQTGFQGTSLSNGSYNNVELSGSNPDFMTLNTWAGLNEHPNIGEVWINYEDGDDRQRLASLVEDDSLGNPVLKFQIMEPHISEGRRKKGRVQMEVSGNQCIREIYQTIRIKFDEDLAYLMQWEERVSWLSIFEFWNNADWTQEKFPFRITVNLFKKETGPVEEMHFHVKGDFKKNCKRCSWNVDWEEENTDFTIPFGEWMDVELHLREGDQSSGKFFMAITPENGNRQVIFDISNRTQHENETCPDGFTHFQPLKWYTGEDLINYMQEGNKELSVYWDDWKLYLNRAP